MEKRNFRAEGTEREQMAADYLKQKGYRILCRNYRIRQGEIDIIALDDQTIVFAEVKYRMNAACGMPCEAVDYRKQQRISRVAVHYLKTHGLWETVSCRFDVIEVFHDSVHHIVNAFEYQGC